MSEGHSKRKVRIVHQVGEGKRWLSEYEGGEVGKGEGNIGGMLMWDDKVQS